MRDLHITEWFRLSTSDLIGIEPLTLRRELKTSAIKTVVENFHRNAENTFKISSITSSFFLAGKSREAALRSGDPNGWQGTQCTNDEINDAIVQLSGFGWFNTREMIRMLMAMQATGMWSDVEVMVGDLWEAAVNAHPKILSNLEGKVPRVKGGNTASDQGDSAPNESEEPNAGDDPGWTYEPSSGERSKDSSKMIEIRLLESCGFDASRTMGTLLRRSRKVYFTSLRDIKESYGKAFCVNRRKSKGPRGHYTKLIMGALNDESLIALAAMRNVILHKNGVCDDDYERESKKTTLIPTLTPPQPFFVDGKILLDVLPAVMRACINLILAVDGWLAASQAYDGDSSKEARESSTPLPSG